MHQLGHALLQGLFVDLVGQFVHDDRLALPPVDVFKMALGPHHHLATPSSVAVFHAIDAVNNARRGEIRCRHDLHEFVDRCLRVAQQVQAGVHHLVEVVRRYVGGHAHGNAARAVDQQVG